MDLLREYAYTVLVPGESWSGHVGGGPKGSGQPGRLTGGVIEASSDQEARAIILEMHGQDAQIRTVEPRTVLVRP